MNLTRHLYERQVFDMSNSYTHLTLQDRIIIAAGISNDSSKTAIADTIGKDKSTVGKEIRLHRFLKYKCRLPRECAAYKKCPYDRNCTPDCPDFVPFRCRRRDRTPGACNGCSRYSGCRFNKYWYNPQDAEKDYRSTLVDTRTGVNMTAAEAKEKAQIIKPLLDQGQSPYDILQAHPELDMSEKTLYTYIESGLFHEINGICSLDLRRQVSRKITKKSGARYKKRHDRTYLKGRLYTDYQTYLQENPEAHVTQMDTVYNDGTDGPFIQTFKFLGGSFLFAVYHDTRTAADMTDGVNLLERILGTALFRKYCEVILTDRGSEFTDAEGMEKDADATMRTRVFYCDPMRAGQKGSLENNHEELRYILPKGVKDLRAIGFTGQDKLNLILSNINSAPVQSCGGKTPFELLQFMFPDLYEKMIHYGLTPIEKDKVILKPYLLK